MPTNDVSARRSSNGSGKAHLGVKSLSARSKCGSGHEHRHSSWFEATTESARNARAVSKGRQCRHLDAGTLQDRSAMEESSPQYSNNSDGQRGKELGMEGASLHSPDG